MDRIAMVRECLHAIEAEEFDRAGKLLCEDFRFMGGCSQPLDKNGWMEVHKSFGTAFPDFSFHLTNVREVDGRVEAVLQLSGTHSGDLDLSSVGLPSLPATGNEMALPMEKSAFFFDRELISRIEVEIKPGGGIRGILEQIGTHAETPS